MDNNGLTAEDLELLLPIFVESGRDYLAAFKNGMQLLDTGGADAECLKSMHRAMHSLKGAALQIGFEPIADLSRSLEDVIAILMRQAPLPPQTSALVVEAVRILYLQIEDVERRRAPQASPPELLASLAACRVGGDPSAR